MMKAILTSSSQRTSTVTLARSATAALAVLPLLNRRCLSPSLISGGLDIGLWLALGFFCQSHALVSATSSEASVMLSLTLVVVGLLELVAGRRLTFRRGIPVLMALAGLGLMETGKPNPSAHADAGRGGWPIVSEGTAWGIASALGFGVHLFRSDVVQDRVDASVQLGALQLVTCAGYHALWVIADLALQPAGAVPGASLSAAWDMPWAEVLFCGVVATGLGQFMELVCVKHAKASSTAIVFAQVPVWGLVLGFFVHGDRLSAVSFLGSALIMCAAAVPHCTRREEGARPA
eukprot:CAMPEP_0177587904 /NCGR_PEP_ID=MMETSP0419_2-20121207/5919_1 /TAXON_ID=582737 /ORGANISM="Tetraselmis sp., Strain GSL018" /LENGTH=290 /DNA_ID=CAMNT_0019078023 /DNA_START=678 /DNA_END=1546 /DNA_ORIENTATION=+